MPCQRRAMSGANFLLILMAQISPENEKWLQAHDAANVKSAIAAIAGLFLGALIGAKSRKLIPGWQIFAAAVAMVLTAGFVDMASGTAVAGFARVAIAGMVAGLFWTRPSPPKVKDISVDEKH